jgi:hypothetical protein
VDKVAFDNKWYRWGLRIDHKISSIVRATDTSYATAIGVTVSRETHEIVNTTVDSIIFISIVDVPSCFSVIGWSHASATAVCLWSQESTDFPNYQRERWKAYHRTRSKIGFCVPYSFEIIRVEGWVQLHDLIIDALVYISSCS